MHLLEQQWAEVLMASPIDRTEELRELRRLLSQSPGRVVVLEGRSGSGKTVLASQFAHTFADDFPGGIEYRSGTGDPDRRIRPGKKGNPSLLVFDGLDEAWPGLNWALGFIQDALARNPSLFALVTSRPIPETTIFERLRLGPLSAGESAELIRRQAGADSMPPQAVIDLAGGNVLMASLLGRIARDRGSWATLIESLRSFTRPGLVDSRGRPLQSRSVAGRAFITDVREVNDWIMRMIHRDPDVVYQLPPRRFEEISAELFTRLGYDVTLTPPSNDGGKDLIVVKRSDLGTMLTFVECKRYTPSQSVGVEVVRALNGVVEEGRATSGIVLTTSRFTKGARTLEHKLQYRMSLKEFSDFKLLLDRAMSSE